jgi:hypothetical protein
MNRHHRSPSPVRPVTFTIEPEPAGPQQDYPNCYSVIPPNGRRCEYTGLKHAKLYQVLGPNGVARPHVRVVNLRSPGASRGQTLFHVGDMLRFLDQLAQESHSQSDYPVSKEADQ